MEKTNSEDPQNTCIIFSMKDEAAGALANFLKLFDQQKVNLMVSVSDDTSVSKWFQL